MTSIYEYLSQDLYALGTPTPNSAPGSQVMTSNTSGEVATENIVSGEIDGNISFIGGFIQSKNFVSGTIGWRLSADGTLEAVNAILSGSITATSGAIGGFSIGTDYIRDAANMTGMASTVTGGDDVRFWAGAAFASRATAPFRVTEAGALTVSSANITGGSITIGTNASIDSSGNATFIGVTSLNMKAYTDFETAGRFIASGGAGTNPPAFGNTGATIITSAVATTFCKVLWQANGFVFNNNASFTASLQCATGFAAGDGVGFIGLGNPTIDGSGFTETGTNYCGFEIKKASGVTTIIPVQCNGGGTVTFGSSFATLSNGTWLELFIKMRSGAIDYYVRVNGGTLSAATTLSATLPSGADNNIQFSLSNKGSANDFSYILGSASYEH